MPIRDNWIESPLDFIEACLGTSAKNIENVKEYFRNRIQELNDLTAIPSINQLQPDLIERNSLVRCRCMVQDQFDPEYYLGCYETFNPTSQEKKLRHGMFRDTSDLEIGEEINHESGKNLTLERQTLYCVPIPGENDWVMGKFASIKGTEMLKEKGENLQNKRQRDEDIASTEEDEKMDMNAEKQDGDNFQKRQRSVHQTEGAATKTAYGGISSQHNSEFDPNFPLPEDGKSPYHIIMYDNNERPKLNEVYEFIGILSCDPELATATMGSQHPNEDQLGFENTGTVEEKLVHCPPASLVPRIHCILAQKLVHTNPLMPKTLELNNGIEESEVEIIRESIIQSLANILFGDIIAAEFILLNIISKIYGRVEPMALGKFSLNITKCPMVVNSQTVSIPNEIGNFLGQVTTKSHLLPLTISNLNQNKFIPKKDYNANRLSAGILQLSEGTHLILDETVLQPGQLNTEGIQNLTAIGNVIQWQKVDYDFQFHKCEMKTDITVLIFSEGRSLLQCDSTVPLIQQSAFSQDASSVISSMNYELVDRMRIYLEHCRLMNFHVTEQLQEVVKNDYVDMREADRKTMNPEVFNLLLVMARLVAISFGKKELTMELWQRTKQLELQRIARFQ